MALGYAPTVREVLAYYDRDDIAIALTKASKGRTIEFYDTPVECDAFETSSDIPSLRKVLAERIRRQLKANMGEMSPEDIPYSYPGLHGSIKEDLVLEVDVKESQRQAFEEGKRIRDYLESKNLPYRVKYSGNCSMHFILPRDLYAPLLPESERSNAFSRLFSYFMRNLKDQINGKLDASFNERDHFLRLPYSLNERTGLVSLPIPSERYDDFKPDWAEMANIRTDTSWFDDDPPQRKRECLEKFIREALIDE